MRMHSIFTDLQTLRFHIISDNSVENLVTHTPRKFLLKRNLNSFFFLNLFIIFGCVGSSLLRVGFLQLWRAGATLCCGAQASHCGGFSCCRARAPGAQASVVVARGLSSCGSWASEHRLSSCGTQAQLLCSTWDLSRPGLEPMSPALADGLPTTVPPGKSHNLNSLCCPLYFLLLFSVELENSWLPFHVEKLFQCFKNIIKSQPWPSLWCRKHIQEVSCK